MASTVFGMIAKAFNAGLFHVAMLHTVEIFPTVIRNSCSSMIMLVGQIGSGISPSIILLGKAKHHIILCNYFKGLVNTCN